MNPMKRKQMEDRLHEVEAKSREPKRRLLMCETQLQTFVSAEETQRQSQELTANKGKLQELMSEWEELSGELADAV